MLRLSVLDQSTVISGRLHDASIRESLALARHCDALGYQRLGHRIGLQPAQRARGVDRLEQRGLGHTASFPGAGA